MRIETFHIAPQRQKEGHDQHARERQSSVSDCVYVRNFGQGELWFPGVISEVTGPVSYTIELTDGSGRTVRQHQDHVRRRHDVLPRTPVGSRAGRGTCC